MQTIMESESRIIIDTTAFVGDNRFRHDQNIAALGNLLWQENVENQIGGLKFSDRHQDVISIVSEIYFDGRTRPPALLDDSSSGGTYDMIDEVETVNRLHGFDTATYTIGRAVFEKTIRQVDVAINGEPQVKDNSSHAAIKMPKTRFLLSTFLPEDFPVEHSALGSYDPVEYTTRVLDQSKVLKDSGYNVDGVYGAACIEIPGSTLALGAGVSFDGSPYDSNGIKKVSVDVETAFKNCNKIIIGRLLLSGVKSNDNQQVINSKVIDNFERVLEIASSVDESRH